MTRKERIAVLGACALICLIFVGIGAQRWCSVAITDAWQRGYEVGLAVERPIPTIEEWQRRLGCEKIDGKLGPAWLDSETQAKWDKALCDQYAIACFEGEE